MRSVAHKAMGLVVIRSSLGSIYTRKSFTEPLSAKSSLDKIDDDKSSVLALVEHMEVVRHFAWSHGFQVSERKYLMTFITGLVLLEIGR